MWKDEELEKRSSRMQVTTLTRAAPRKDGRCVCLVRQGPWLHAQIVLIRQRRRQATSLIQDHEWTLMKTSPRVGRNYDIPGSRIHVEVCFHALLREDAGVSSLAQRN